MNKGKHFAGGLSKTNEGRLRKHGGGLRIKFDYEVFVNVQSKFLMHSGFRAVNLSQIVSPSTEFKFKN